MNAKELLVLIDDVGLLELVARSAREKDGWIQQTILRALSLLADAEANDGTTPETDAARLTINQRRMIAEGRGVVSEMVEASVARRLERECNGLAAEVLRLKTMLPDDYARADMESREP